MDLSLRLSLARNQPSGGGGISWPTFALGAKIITVGDSITQDANLATSDGTQVYNQNDGIINWALARVPFFKHNIWYDAAATGTPTPQYFRGANYGDDGDTATNVYDRITPILNSGADIAVVLIGTNTGSTDTSATVKIAKIQLIVDALVNQGIFVVIGTILPRTVRESPTGYQITPAIMAEIITTNTFIRTLESNDVAVWDAWEDMLDPAYDINDPEYGSILPAYTKDSVHLSQKGANATSISLAAVLSQLTASSDVWTGPWFENNGESNRFTNGDFSGTSGSKVNGVTGTVATSWTAQQTASGNCTAVASLVDNANTGGKSQRLAITSDGLGGGVSGENILLYGSTALLNNAGLSNGDYVQMFVKVKVTNNTSGVLGGIKFYLVSTGTPNIYTHGMDLHSTSVKTYPAPTGDLDLWIQSEPVQWLTGTTFFYYLSVTVIESIAGSVTVDFERVRYKKVTSPVVEFPYTP